MEIGLMIRYGKLVPGREEQAFALFEETVHFFGERLARHEITAFEPYFMGTSDLEEETGFFLLRGPAPEIFRLMEDETYLQLMQKGMMLVEHLRIDLLTVGEGVQEQIVRARKVLAELGV